MKCVGCGCTDARACAGGCVWIHPKRPVCSSCYPTPADISSRDLDVHHNEIFEQVIAIAKGWGLPAPRIFKTLK